MKLSTSFGTLAILVPAVLAASLPKCSSTSTTPCICPSGTQYEQSVTFAVIGAAATDVKALTSDFYEIAWFGVVPFATKGPNNTPGVSLRSAHLPTLVGTYDITEKLTELKFKPDGSFIQKFELLPSSVPVEYDSRNGSFSGWWVTLESKHIFQYETAIRWSVYACETGHPQNFAKFHEEALDNATNVLKAAGKVLGTNVAPISIQGF